MTLSNLNKIIIHCNKCERLVNFREKIAKEKVVYKGCKSRIDVERIKTLKKEGLGASAIAKQMGIHRDSVYRLLKESK